MQLVLTLAFYPV